MGTSGTNKPLLALPGPTHYARGPLATGFQCLLDRVRSDAVHLSGLTDGPSAVSVLATHFGVAQDEPEAVASRLRLFAQRLDEVYTHAHHGLLVGGMHPVLGIELAENLLFAQARDPVHTPQVGILEVRINLTLANSIDDAFGDRYLNEVKKWLCTKFGSAPGVVTHGGLPTIFRVTTTKDREEIAAILADFRHDLTRCLHDHDPGFRPEAAVGYVALSQPPISDTLTIAEVLTWAAHTAGRAEQIKVWRHKVLDMIERAHLQAAVLTAFAESLRREGLLTEVDRERRVFTMDEAMYYRTTTPALEARWVEYARRRPGYVPVGCDVPSLRKMGAAHLLTETYQGEHIRYPRPRHDLGRARHIGSRNGGGYLDQLQQHLDRLARAIETGGEWSAGQMREAVDHLPHLVALSVWADRDLRYPDAYPIGSRDAVEYAHTPLVAAIAAEACDHLAVIDVDGLRAFGQAYPPQARDDDYFWLLDIIRSAFAENGVSPPVMGIRGDTMVVSFRMPTKGLDGRLLRAEAVLARVQQRVREHFASQPFQDWKKCPDGTRKPLWVNPAATTTELLAAWPAEVPAEYRPFMRTLTLTVAYGDLRPLTTHDDIQRFWEAFLTLSNHTSVLKKRRAVQKEGLARVTP